MITDVAEIERSLAELFPLDEVKFKPGKVAGNRAMAMVYIDARVVQDRLDDVIGPMNWQDDYQPLPDGCVVCRLRLRMGDEWITKVDVGSPSEQPDEGDRTKAAFSDALKRAAVKFGIGRYLYRVGVLWADYDPQKKKFVRDPELPAAFRPGKPAPAKPPAAPAQQSAAQTTAPPKKATKKEWGEKIAALRLQLHTALGVTDKSAQDALLAEVLLPLKVARANDLDLAGLEKLARLLEGRVADAKKPMTGGKRASGLQMSRISQLQHELQMTLADLQKQIQETYGKGAKSLLMPSDLTEEQASDLIDHLAERAAIQGEQK